MTVSNKYTIMSYGTTQSLNSSNNWHQFKRILNYEEIIAELKIIPSSWSLTPVKAKRPYRENWQHEEMVSRSQIKELLEKGAKATSKRTGNPYHYYISGYGLRTGNGLLAIDIDGESAKSLLLKMAGGKEINTVSWTSGKIGRSQLLVRIPLVHLSLIDQFTRKIITEWEGFKTAEGELLEFRYQKCQSILPPSHHPETGFYSWINSPEDTEVAIAPEWLCDFILKCLDQEKQAHSIAQEKQQQKQKQRYQRELTGDLDLVDYLDSAIDELGLEAYNWEGHNFFETKDRLEGCCPHHKSNSQRSFHVNKSTLEWFCWGCQVGGGVVQYKSFVERGRTEARGKEFYEIVTNLCQEAGITIKKNVPQNRGRKTNTGNTQDSSNEVRKKAHKRDLRTKRIKYIPGKVIDWQYCLENDIKITYAPQHRQEFWQEIPLKFILDKSATGTGKSHTAGEYSNDEGKTFFITSNHRNPTTITVERNFSDLPTRNIGLKKDLERFTPLGEHYLNNVKPHEISDVSANCHYAHYFNLARNKGYSLETPDGSLNPICQACNYNVSCINDRDRGYGYRYERKEALQNSRLRCHIDSLPSLTEHDYSHDVAIVDEAETQISSIKVIEATLADFDNLLMRIAEQDLKCFTILLQSLTPIRDLLGNATKLSGIEKKYGIDHESIIESLHIISENVTPIVDKLEQFLPDFGSLIEQSDRVAAPCKELIGLAKAANRQFHREAQQQTAKNFQSLPTNFLLPLLNICLGTISGALRITPQKTLQITIADPTHRDKLHQFSKVILLDATAEPERLASILETEKILVVEAESELPTNLEIVYVDLPGFASNDWSASAIARKDALVSTLKQKHPDLEVISLKKYAAGEGYWFKDSRGTNRYQGVNAIAAFGKPQINVGAAKDLYRSVYGNLNGFNRYYRSLVEKETLQLIGRQRAQLFPDQNFTLYLCSSGLDLSFLLQRDIKVSKIKAFDICPEAGTKQQFRRYQLVKVIADLLQQGKDISQKHVAEFMGIRQAQVSKIANQVKDGWRLLVVFLSLNMSSYSTRNILECAVIRSWILEGLTDGFNFKGSSSLKIEGYDSRYFFSELYLLAITYLVLLEDVFQPP